MRCGDVEANPGPKTTRQSNTPVSDAPLKQATLQRDGAICIPPDPLPHHKGDPTNADIFKAIQDMSLQFSSFDQRMAQIEVSLRGMETQQASLQMKVNELDRDNAMLLEENIKIKQAVSSLEKQLQESSKRNKKLNENADRLEATVRALEDARGQNETKLDNLESHSKRNNLIFHGIEKSSNQETWEECESLLKATIKNEMRIDEDIQFERVHRLNTKGKVKPIIAKFTYHKQRNIVLNAKKTLQAKASKIFINEDYTKRVREVRNKLAGFLNEARESGKRAKLVHDHLIIEGEHFVYNYEEDKLAPRFSR